MFFEADADTLAAWGLTLDQAKALLDSAGITYEVEDGILSFDAPDGNGNWIPDLFEVTPSPEVTMHPSWDHTGGGQN